MVLGRISGAKLAPKSKTKALKNQLKILMELEAQVGGWGGALGPRADATKALAVP